MNRQGVGKRRNRWEWVPVTGLLVLASGPLAPAAVWAQAPGGRAAAPARAAPARAVGARGAAATGAGATTVSARESTAPRPGATARAAAAPRPARKGEKKVRRYTLAQLVALARRSNSTLAAARARIKAYEAQVFAAKWSWLPVVKLTTQVAPTPKYQCQVPDEFLPESWTAAQRSQWRETKVDGVANKNRYCVTTQKDINVQDYSVEGLYLRFEASAAIPVSAFWKMPYLLRAARAGQSVGQHQVAAAVLRVEKAVHKAYNAVKLAREMLYTIEEGRKHLDKALRRVEKELDSDEGEASMADKFRLKILKSEVDAWTVDSNKMVLTALSGLRALTGHVHRKDASNLDVDEQPLEAISADLKPLSHYRSLARHHRPEIRMMNAAAAAARAAVKLQYTSFWPDLALALKYSYTLSNSDDPVSAYARDSLHGNSIFVGLVLKFDLDFHIKHARYARAQARARAAARSVRAMREKVDHEVTRARAEVSSAKQKIKLAEQGHQAARSWLTAVSQQHDVGTARAKEVSDALRAFFKTKIALIKAIYEHNMAVADLRTTVGTSVSASNRK